MEVSPWMYEISHQAIEGAEEEWTGNIKITMVKVLLSLHRYVK